MGRRRGCVKTYIPWPWAFRRGVHRRDPPESTDGPPDETHKNEMHDIRTGAAGDARHVGQLVLRTYSQASGDEMRRRALDSIDELLRFEAYGFGDLVSAAER